MPSSTAAASPALDFVIVGTPRSGTTLVQRLAGELPGVRIPAETHFFSLFAPGLIRRRRFPLDEDGLRAELQTFAAMPSSRPLGVDPDAIVEELGHGCASLADLFAAVVRQVAGPGRLHGEKTPTHLLWWRPLTQAFPALRMVAVVRDPRAVVASNLPLPWGMSSPVPLAQRWSSDQRQVLLAQQELGDRVLVLRYEEIVADPRSARGRLGRFVGALGPATSTAVRGDHDAPAPPGLHRPEGPWNQRAFGPITRDRVDVWRESLTPSQTRTVIAICRREMSVLGYDHDHAGTMATAMRLARLAPGAQWRRAHFLRERRRRLAEIENLAGEPGIVGRAALES